MTEDTTEENTEEEQSWRDSHPAGQFRTTHTHTVFVVQCQQLHKLRETGLFMGNAVSNLVKSTDGHWLVCVCIRFLWLCGHILVKNYRCEDISVGPPNFKRLFKG